MADVTVKRMDQMDSMYDGAFLKARHSLGVSSFGFNIMKMPPNWDRYPEHDERSTRQEEVYTALSGSGKLVVEGVEHELRPGVFARVGAGVKRKIVPGDDGLELLALGGVPGEAYAPPDWSKSG